MVKDETLIDGLRLGLTRKYLALGHGARPSLRLVRTLWPRVKHFTVRTSHTVDKCLEWTVIGFKETRFKCSFLFSRVTYLVGKSCTFLDDTKKKSSTACRGKKWTGYSKTVTRESQSPKNKQTNKQTNKHQSLGRKCKPRYQDFHNKNSYFIHVYLDVLSTGDS